MSQKHAHVCQVPTSTSESTAQAATTKSQLQCYGYSTLSQVTARFTMASFIFTGAKDSALSCFCAEKQAVHSMLRALAVDGRSKHSVFISSFTQLPFTNSDPEIWVYQPNLAKLPQLSHSKCIQPPYNQVPTPPPFQVGPFTSTEIISFVDCGQFSATTHKKTCL